MSLWKPLIGRISIAASKPTPPGALSALELYQQIWKSDPTNFQNSPNPLMVSAAQGIALGMTASCAVVQNRADISLTPNAQDAATSVSLALRLIEDRSALYGELSRITQSIGNGTIKIPSEYDRVSTFIQYVSIEDDALAANAAVAKTIPERFRPRLTNEDAFILQVNIPTVDRRFGDTQINFLTKWSVEQFQVVSFGLAMGGTQGQGIPMPQLTSKSYLGACLSCECNFPTQNTPNRDQQIKSLIGFLGVLAEMQHDYGLNVDELPYDKIAR
jgi:hypothetical protein